MLAEKKSGQAKKNAQEGRRQELLEDSAGVYAVAGGFDGDKRSEEEPCVIVGIGASAGGLEAFIRLLKKLPGDTGMAFVLVQHLDPNHKSILTEILSRTTSMPVSAAWMKRKFASLF